MIHDMSGRFAARVVARVATAIAILGLAIVGLAACGSTTSGSGHHVVISSGAPHTTSATGDFPSTTAPGTSSSAAPNATVIPAPAHPLRTASITVGSTVYNIAVWQQRNDPTCVGHAYGQPVIAFLAAHPCYNGLNRLLGTVTINGRAAGFAQSTLTIQTPGGADPYKNSETFKKLVEASNTGSITDLLRDGYRLPSGPTSIPAHEAFTVLGQDSTVEIWDAWYLTGPTPDNDPVLIKTATDIFLQY